ncbi:MAG: hypothetical protein ABWY56_07315 [Propionibacteriaceae bacterium]
MPSGRGSGLVEVWTLARGAARLWRAHFWRMGSWFCVGFAVHTLGLLLSAELGAEHGLWATLLFVVGVVATLVALVLMIHTVEGSLRTPTLLQPDAAILEELRIPGQLFVRERSVEVVAAAVGPFLAVYAVWGFVDEEIRNLFASNYAIQGLGGITNFSISFSPDRLRFYVLVAAAAWVLRLLLTAVLSRRRLTSVALVSIVVEALWVFSVFAVLVIVLRTVRDWLRTRAVWVAVQDGWRALVEWLPPWPLPFGFTLPQAVDRLLEVILGTVLPGAAQAIALPLLWLALTATVLGWREFRAGDLLAGTPLAGRLVGSEGRAPRTRRVAAWLTSDLRTKYLPVISALRLIWRAGPRFLGAYLVLATVLNALQQCFDIGLSLALGPREVAVTLLTEPFSLLISGLLFTTAAIALYAAAFDEALAAAVRSGTNRPR